MARRDSFTTPPNAYQLRNSGLSGQRGNLGKQILSGTTSMFSHTSNIDPAVTTHRSRHPGIPEQSRFR